MLAKPGPMPTGPGWSYEVKWDGFRAHSSPPFDGLQVRSRRGWNMTEALPELRALPEGLILDGELVAFNKAGDPHFPLIGQRVLHRDRSVQVQLMIFDLLSVDGESVTHLSYAKRVSGSSSSASTSTGGQHPTPSTTARRSMTLCASVASRGSWRSGGARVTGRRSAAGSR